MSENRPPYGADCLKVDQSSVKPVICPNPACGEIVGYEVKINGEKWLWIDTMFFPWIPVSFHKCGTAVFFGKKKNRVTAIG